MAVNNTYSQTSSVINTPGDGNTTVQYNKNGSFAGDNGLKYNHSTKELSVQSNINIGGWVKGKIYTNTYNFFLNGGNSGQVLSTDGTGNLSWVDNSGGGSSNYGNSNVSSYLATFTGNVAAGYIWDGQYINPMAGAQLAGGAGGVTAGQPAWAGGGVGGAGYYSGGGVASGGAAMGAGGGGSSYIKPGATGTSYTTNTGNGFVSITY